MRRFPVGRWVCEKMRALVYMLPRKLGPDSNVVYLGMAEFKEIMPVDSPPTVN